MDRVPDESSKVSSIGNGLGEGFGDRFGDTLGEGGDGMVRIEFKADSLLSSSESEA